MKTRVQRWGNSLAVRIPKAFAVELGLRERSRVELRLNEGNLVVEPCGPPPLDLADLLAGVTEENLHTEVHWGPPRGREIW